MDENRGFTIKDLLIRLVLIIVFIFLLIWLFPMPDLKPLNNQIFADNIDRMKNVAKTYYTVERLPKDFNESKKMTLKEMIDNKLILPLMDSNGKYCSEKDSYIQITKLENEYIIKVYLSCTDKQDYIIEHFGCYDICSDKCRELATTTRTTLKNTYKSTTKDTYKSTTKNTTLKPTTGKITTRPTVTTTKNNGKIYEYEFTKRVCKEEFDKYTCPTGYNLVNNKCIKKGVVTSVVAAEKKVNKVTSVDEKNAKPVVTNSTKKEKANCKEEIKSSTINATAKQNLSDKVLVGTQKVTATTKVTLDVKGAVGTKTTVTADYIKTQNYDVITATKYVSEYKWKYVSTIVSTKSNLAKTSDKEKIVLYDSWEELTCTTCFTTVRYYKYFKYQKEAASYSYSCSNFPGYSLYDGNKCRKATTVTKTCPSGYTDNGSSCTKSNVTYSCSKYGKDYVLDNNKLTCTKTTYSYSCPAGTEKTSDPKYCNKKVYGCPSGTTESNGKCAKTVYSCPANTSTTTYTLSGTKCAVKTKTKVCKCDNGTTPTSDNYCVITNSKTEYTCKDYPGYTLNGKKCTKTTTKENITYSCKKGVLQGQQCIIAESKEYVKNAEAKYKTTCHNEYKWSTNTHIDGWTYTGNKRQIN